MGLENSSDIIFSREWRISYMMYSSVRVLNTFFVFKSEIPATRSGRINERPILLFSNKVQLNIYVSQDYHIWNGRSKRYGFCKYTKLASEAFLCENKKKSNKMLLPVRIEPGIYAI